MRRSSSYHIMLGFFLSTQMLCSLEARSQSKYAYAPPARPLLHLHNTDNTDSLINPRHFPLRKQALMEVLTELNNAKGAFFLFADPSWGAILVNPPVITPNTPIEKILDQVLKNSGLKYSKVDDRTFVILAVKQPGTTTGFDPVSGNRNGAGLPTDQANETTIRNTIAGRVRTLDGKALEGVSITIKGTPQGSFTDAAGAYSLYAHTADILVFSFVGYKSKEMAAGEPGSAEIILEPCAQ